MKKLLLSTSLLALAAFTGTRIDCALRRSLATSSKAALKNFTKPPHTTPSRMLSAQSYTFNSTTPVPFSTPYQPYSPDTSAKQPISSFAAQLPKDIAMISSEELKTPALQSLEGLDIETLRSIAEESNKAKDLILEYLLSKLGLASETYEGLFSGFFGKTTNTAARRKLQEDIKIIRAVKPKNSYGYLAAAGLFGGLFMPEEEEGKYEKTQQDPIYDLQVWIGRTDGSQAYSEDQEKTIKDIQRDGNLLRYLNLCSSLGLCGGFELIDRQTGRIIKRVAYNCLPEDTARYYALITQRFILHPKRASSYAEFEKIIPGKLEYTDTYDARTFMTHTVGECFTLKPQKPIITGYLKE